MTPILQHATAAFSFATAQKILFGPGRCAELPEIVAGLGKRLLLVAGSAPRGAEGLAPAARFAVSSEPTFDLAREGTDLARENGCDVVVAIGGGSVLDAGKAIAMLLTNGGDPLDYAEVIGSGLPIARAPAPFIAVPTTAGTGSEATRNAVLASHEHRVKVSLRSPLMLPRVALVDPDLALGLPPAITASTGMDALSQLIEPFVSSRATPLTDALCRDGIARAARALPRVVEYGRDREARAEMALAALYSGMALANAGLGAVHGFAAPIGGMFEAPHGAVCAALLPVVFEKNFQSLERSGGSISNGWKFDEVARLVTGRPNATAADGARWLADLRIRLEIPGLGAYGVKPEHVDELVRAALKSSSMKGNPIVLSADELSSILVAAL